MRCFRLVTSTLSSYRERRRVDALSPFAIPLARESGIPLAETAGYLRARQKEFYGDKVLSTDSAEEIRQAREERAIQIEEAL